MKLFSFLSENSLTIKKKLFNLVYLSRPDRICNMAENCQLDSKIDEYLHNFIRRTMLNSSSFVKTGFGSEGWISKELIPPPHLDYANSHLLNWNSSELIEEQKLTVWNQFCFPFEIFCISVLLATIDFLLFTDTLPTGHILFL